MGAYELVLNKRFYNDIQTIQLSYINEVYESNKKYKQNGLRKYDEL